MRIFIAKRKAFEYFSESPCITIRREQIVISRARRVEPELGSLCRFEDKRCSVTEVMEGNEQEFEIYRAFEQYRVVYRRLC